VTSTVPTLERISVLVAWGLFATVLLSFFGVEHQVYISRQRVLQEFSFLDIFVWFCPAVAVLIFRKYWFVVAVYAIPILVLFVARVCFFWQLKATGVNSIHQKGDWAIWLHWLLSGVSGVVLFYWLLGYLIVLSAKYRIDGNE
jgi:hypothetical protein